MDNFFVKTFRYALNILKVCFVRYSCFASNLSHNFKKLCDDGRPRLLRRSGGFSILEFIIAVGLFSIIISISVGGFVRALRSQQQAIGLVAANTNLSLALEQMAREMRVGILFCLPATATTPDTSCPPGRSDYVRFVNGNGQVVSYCRGADGLKRAVGVDCDTSGQKLTGDIVTVTYVKFVLAGNIVGDGLATRVTISIGIAPNYVGVNTADVNVQTTVSVRNLDV